MQSNNSVRFHPAHYEALRALANERTGASGHRVSLTACVTSLLAPIFGVPTVQPVANPSPDQVGNTRRKSRAA